MAELRFENWWLTSESYLKKKKHQNFYHKIRKTEKYPGINVQLSERQPCNYHMDQEIELCGLHWWSMVGYRFDPWSGTKIHHAMHGQK